MTQTIITSEEPSPRFVSVQALRRARRLRVTLAWSVWGVAVIFVLFQFFLQLSSGQIITGIMRTFALTALGGAVITSSYYYIYTILQVPAGLLMDRFGPRGVLSVGALVVCIGSFIFALAKTVGLALIGRILMGGGAAFAFVGCLSLISIWFPVRRFAVMAAIVETVGMLGAVFGSLWLAHFIRTTGWQESMLIAGIVAAALSGFLWFVVRNTPRRKKFPIRLAGAPIQEGLKRLAKNPVVWLNGIYSGLAFSIVTVFTALWSVPFIEVAHHVGMVTASISASFLYVGVAVGGPLIGWLDGATTWRRDMMIMNIFCAAILLFAIIFWISSPLWVVSTLMFFSGCFASSYVLTFAIANEIATPANRATSIGFTNMLCVVFAPILQPLVGFLIIHWDDHPSIHHGVARSLPHFQWALSVIPVLLIASAFIAYFLPKKE
ncbi:MAG: hypothetical protein A3I77_05370 [Gammaproteobacteria bacterium RIFCSPLOWO2_02_FULL_42_14]|nr:MAG: hypothetical protein A3B71_01935 [Gammaproteobacteria bacterium RIFCSPHIGHO2_02_FULL_42_43]OGT28366.1 MAG: hypothetical protein A2624_02845 [Gammaproteobacteria bacterium RIFCSPHIGHO2_01_FULL_42_8]OGT51202.1 MAG: hypothetical protein A3E54_03125 [Gammaproteobacteria bacterium RIFCSPHIGHO2_12_FULL_41_25]OGT62964.1 MAG: hypothetical protein A3I77_05370 [Gammaproteobacteria bacterium RIFCSPLOWO2_02_FULL_42_14]OGT86096.1 MAG: hypothetical protein A3G86_02925 [Gammaproteobacteria bacterium R